MKTLEFLNTFLSPGNLWALKFAKKSVRISKHLQLKELPFYRKIEPVKPILESLVS